MSVTLNKHNKENNNKQITSENENLHSGVTRLDTIYFLDRFAVRLLPTKYIKTAVFSTKYTVLSF